MTLTGITWDHPRGYAGLEALGREAGDTNRAVDWRRQSLEGFESTPVASLAPHYDLMIIDHPNLGAAIAAGALVPLDAVFEPAELSSWSAESVGPSFDSYRIAGTPWAVPIDAATQVSVATGAVDELPGTWDEAIALAARVPSALCLGGPHAFLMFAALCVALGEEPCASPGFVASRPTAESAYEIMAELLVVADRSLSRLAPIALLERMSATGGPDYCPLVYGYMTYHASGRPRPLHAGNAPTVSKGSRVGSVLGGTGMAVSALRHHSSPDQNEIRRLIREVMNRKTQVETYLAHGGQASSAKAWSDDRVNFSVGGFYRDTRQTIEGAWIRPREPYYPAFQVHASSFVREGLFSRSRSRDVLTELDRAYAKRRAGIDV